MAGLFDPDPPKSPAQLRREADLERRIEKQHDRDAQREQEQMENQNPGGTGRVYELHFDTTGERIFPSS